MKNNLSLKEIREKIAAKSKVVHDIFEEAGTDLDFSKVSCLGEMDTKSKVEKVQSFNKELAELNDDYRELFTIEAERKKAADLNMEFNQPAEKAGPEPEHKSIGKLIMESGIHKSRGITKFLPDVDLKADFFLGTPGWPAESIRIPGVSLYPTRPVTVVDYIPTLPTTQNLVKYMKETTFTNTAAEKAEGGAGVEATLVLGESSDEVEKITVYIPVSEEQLEDVPAAEGYLTSRLAFMVHQKLDAEILEGDGNTPNLLGTLNLAAIQSQALGTDTRLDCLYKAFDLIRTVGFTEASVLFINPADWQPVRLARTADGIYILGSPQDPNAGKSVWGVPVVQTSAVTVNTALTGDYANFSTLYIRKGVEVEMSNGYEDFFIKGKLAVKATMRCAMVHFRIPAFAKITGI